MRRVTGNGMLEEGKIMYDTLYVATYLLLGVERGGCLKSVGSDYEVESDKGW